MSCFDIDIAARCALYGPAADRDDVADASDTPPHTMSAKSAAAGDRAVIRDGGGVDAYAICCRDAMLTPARDVVVVAARRARDAMSSDDAVVDYTRCYKMLRAVLRYWHDITCSIIS